MKAKDIPPMQKALADLFPYFPTFYDAFESGTDHAKGYFEGVDAPHDPWLHAHLIRHWVKRFLIQHDVDTQEYEPENLANSGLQFTVKDWFVRMRKSARGAVPLPGRSRTMQAFYQQILPEEFSDMHNVLLLWNATPAGDFKGLSLVYPLSATGQEKWRADIPHPAKVADITTSYQTTFEEVGDLEIEPLYEGDEDIEAEGQ